MLSQVTMATGGWLLLVVIMMTMIKSIELFRNSRPRDCRELRDSGNPKFMGDEWVFRNGVKTIYVGCRQRPVKVYCDMEGQQGSFGLDGGWTVLLLFTLLSSFFLVVYV